MPLIVDDQSIDPVLAAEGLDKIAAEEAFMNEVVEVLLAETTDENAAPHIILNVNGVNQPVFRGVPTRHAVAVLSRCWRAARKPSTTRCRTNTNWTGRS